MPVTGAGCTVTVTDIERGSHVLGTFSGTLAVVDVPTLEFTDELVEVTEGRFETHDWIGGD
jgi:hypothetical protein